MSLLKSTGMQALRGLPFLLLTGCSLEPTYGPTDANRNYACYTTTSAISIAVEYRDDEAIIMDGDERIHLQFVQSIWPRYDDIYEGHGYTLTLDPEAGLKRPDGSRLGPCQ